MMKKRRRYKANEIVKKPRVADELLSAGKSVGETLHSWEISEATMSRWRTQYGGMKSEVAQRLKQFKYRN